MDIGCDNVFKLEDKKIKFDSSFNFEALEYINSGGNATVYKLKVDDEYYALKIFKTLAPWKVEKFERKLDLSIPSFISPIKISYFNNKFNGYLMKLCRGDNLLEQNLDISIGDFIRSSDKLFYDTNLLSESKYLIQDISKTNVMFDGGFKVIDMDFYAYCPEGVFNDSINNIGEIRRYNKKSVTRVLIDIFAWNAEIKKLFEQVKELEQLENDCIIGKISLNQFLSTLCGLVCRNEEYESTKIEEVGKRLIRIIK